MCITPQIGYFIHSILFILSLQGPREEAADDFIQFICNNIDRFHNESAGINELPFINSLEKVNISGGQTFVFI